MKSKAVQFTNLPSLLKYLSSAALGLVIGASLLTASTASAYLPIAESAEVLPAGQYRVGVIPQVFTGGQSGLQVSPYIDSQVTDSASIRALIGSGTYDFNAAASLKYIPFPDIEEQPAMGFKTSLSFARNVGENFLNLQIAPMASKKVDSEYGLFIPYVALPISFINAKSENYNATQIVFGSEFKTEETPFVTYGAEVALNMNKSESYLAGFISIPFDADRGIGR